MITSLVIVAVFWGADPGIVFSGDRAPLVRPVYQAQELPVTSRPKVRPVARQAGSAAPSTAIPSVLGEKSILRPDVVRGQTVCNDTCIEPGMARRRTACDEFFDEPYVQDFIHAMNPFHDEVVRTLPCYYDPFGYQMGTGSNGYAGYRLGWSTLNELAEMPYAATRGSTGNFSDFEWNSYVRYAEVIAPGVLFQGTGYFNARWWEGPGSTTVPGQVDQISTDLQLSFFNEGPWSGQVAFHPQIVSTYEAPLDWNAFNFDGRAIAMYKASPEWSFVGGVQYWDRVDQLVIPTGGAIWTPNNRWELRMLFPKSRISYLLGNWRGADHWIYGTYEYSAEAYQSFDKQTAYSDRIQITDDRLTLGIRADKGRYSWYFEGGWVFNRQVKFGGSTPNFNLDDTALLRVGFMY